MKQTTSIEAYDNQCTVDDLWQFIEDNLRLPTLWFPMNWIPKTKLEKYRKRKCIFVATDGGNVVGCIALKGGSIEVLCVKKYHRRKGIGSQLVKHAESALKRDKRRKFMAVDSSYKFKAKRFYEKMGFATYSNGKDDLLSSWDTTWHFKKKL